MCLCLYIHTRHEESYSDCGQIGYLCWSLFVVSWFVPVHHTCNFSDASNIKFYLSQTVASW